MLPRSRMHIVVAKRRVRVSTAEAVFEGYTVGGDLDPKGSGKPSLLLVAAGVRRQFGNLDVAQGTRLFQWAQTDEENEQFRATWYIPENNTGHVMSFGKAGYQVNFVAQRGNEVWYGGDQWLPFVDSGLYRFNLKTGDFHRFSPADGFRPLYRNTVYDGLWLEDRLWLATSGVVCRETDRSEERDALS